MNIENILVPTDFSKCADNALSYAANIAKKIDAGIHLMYTESSAYSYTALDRLNAQIDNEAVNDIDIRTVIEAGHPGPSILKQIKETSADLVVMGNKGRSGGRMLFGSTTLKIISDSPVPVMAIPEKTGFKDLKQVVFATDYHTGDLTALSKIVNWARKFNSELHVFHVSLKDEADSNQRFGNFKEKAEEQTDYDKLIFDRVVSESFFDGFSDYLDEHKIRLLVITRYKKSFIQQVVEKDHTKQIEYYSNVPLLVLNSEQSS